MICSHMLWHTDLSAASGSACISLQGGHTYILISHLASQADNCWATEDDKGDDKS